MTWLRIDDDAADHPKVIAMGNDGFGLLVRCAAWSAKQLQDGRVPRALVLMYALGDVELIARLLTIGSLEVNPDDPAGDYLIHDFLDRNPTRAEVLAEREAARLRQAKRRGKTPVTPNEPPLSRRDRHSDERRVSGDPDPTRPDPKETPSPIAPSGAAAEEITSAATDVARGLASLDLHTIGEQARQIRAGLGQPVALWRDTQIRQAFTAAVVDGHDPADLEHAFLTMTADPDTRVPGRLVKPGPWWEAAEVRQLDEHRRQAAETRANCPCTNGWLEDAADGKPRRCTNCRPTRREASA